MDIEELKKLIALMNKNDLVELELESKESKVRLKKASPQAPQFAPMPMAMPMHPMHVGPAPVSGSAVSHHQRDAGKGSHAPVIEGGSVTFNSPMVGTFYSSPAPGAESFVKVGERIGPKTVLCIIEAMKVMNEITAETEGELLEVLVGNGEAVEFGQPLFTIRPLR